MNTTSSPTIDLLNKFRPHLWGCTILFFGVADVVTTSVGLQLGGVAEVGPVVAPFIRQHGLAAMILLKVGTFGVCYLMYRTVPWPYNLGVPLGLAALGGLVSVWNTILISIILI